MRTRESVTEIIKAYDVRGIVGEQITADFIHDVGAAFGNLMRAEGQTTVAIGHDMRPSSPELAQAFADGVRAQGLDVVMLGLTSTDQLYFVSGVRDIPGAMFTASHNPAEYNGIKMCRSGARPVGQETGLAAIIDMLIAGVPLFDGKPGGQTTEDSLAAYGEFLRSVVPPQLMLQTAWRVIPFPKFSVDCR